MEDWKRNVMEIVKGALLKINEHAAKDMKALSDGELTETGAEVGFSEIGALAQPASYVLEALECLMYESANMDAFSDNYRHLDEALEELYLTSEFEDETPYPIK